MSTAPFSIFDSTTKSEIALIGAEALDLPHPSPRPQAPYASAGEQDSTRWLAIILLHRGALRAALRPTLRRAEIDLKIRNVPHVVRSHLRRNIFVGAPL